MHDPVISYPSLNLVLAMHPAFPFIQISTIGWDSLAKHWGDLSTIKGLVLAIAALCGATLSYPSIDQAMTHLTALQFPCCAPQLLQYEPPNLGAPQHTSGSASR